MKAAIQELQGDLDYYKEERDRWKARVEGSVARSTGNYSFDRYEGIVRGLEHAIDVLERHARSTKCETQHTK